jgi:1-acyl-sn-glycerol-3-phosphate acyltransferase
VKASVVNISDGGEAVFRRGFFLWRLICTVLAFAVLGLGGLVIATLIVPLANSFVAEERARNRRAQSLIRASFRLYLWLLQATGVLQLEVIGGDQLLASRGKLVIANHPTLLDIVILMALLPNATCVGKRQLWLNPVLRPVVRAAGYIRNDSEPEIFIAQCRATLLAGSNLIIFPEGTRSVAGQPLRFHRGFAHIALASGAGLRPVLITCKPITLVKGEPYYRIPASPPHFRIEVSDEIDAACYAHGESSSRALQARKLVSYIESDYARRLHHG